MTFLFEKAFWLGIGALVAWYWLKRRQPPSSPPGTTPGGNGDGTTQAEGCA